MGTSPTSALAELAANLPDLMLRDEHRLRHRIANAREAPAGQVAAIVAEITADIETARLRIERRRTVLPDVAYPAELPISERAPEIATAIHEHQVVIVAGETGSGKTTQLPKICLEIGRGVRGLIGHTQPRRLAARTVAGRIAEELHTPLGVAVGYKVRFTDRIGEDTLVKLMTDGILLAELASDRQLRQYDTLIIDEAHERSLNIDFILGYLKQLLPSRPDLKVIITSATIDPHRFAEHFAGAGVPAPVIEVSGRTYPVETRYRPVVDPNRPESADRDQVQAICDAVDELCAEGPGDILVFLSGEREIRDTADALGRKELRGTEVLPLYARLSAAEQHRVFGDHRGRRIVLATNVAETSLTVPGIKYVIDPGTARISRYSHRTKVQRLPIEAVSAASANQRKGRCGRTSDGICIRLYSEQDFAARPEFTDPEILRTNLASVILQMAALGLGEIGKFGFLDPPDTRDITAGIQLLHELGALEKATKDGMRRLTGLGRKLAQLPIDPRLARMVLAAESNGCVREVIVITAGLSIVDPRERPADRQQAADEQHARFADKTSDFLGYLNLWNYLREQQRALSSSRFRKLCRAEYLNYLRVREWQDVESQLRQTVQSLGITVNDTPAEPQRIHQSLLAGLLSQIGLADPARHDYLGARNVRFAIFPGSALFKKQPRWVMAAELVETSRLWARVVAGIQPEWVEPLAGHLVKRGYSEPHWERKAGAVMAYEKVTLYGVPLVVSRKVNYGRIEPDLCRELFIRHALVEGDWETRHEFFAQNRKLLAEVEELEHRARRRDILVDDQALFDFYDQRIGDEVVSARHFDSWWKQTRQERPDLLNFEKSALMNVHADVVGQRDYPDSWRRDDLCVPLTYQFEPGADADGVTAHVPLEVLNRLDPGMFSWQVPGLREELVTTLIKSLPKPLRRNVIPAPDFAKAALAEMNPETEPLLDALERELYRLGGVRISRDAWELDRIPDHLRITFRVLDGKRRILAEGKDLGKLKAELAETTRTALSEVANDIERTGLKTASFGTLPRVFEQRRNGNVVRAYPALVDERDSVAVRLFGTETEQREAMWSGTRRLLLLVVPSPVNVIRRSLSNDAKLALNHNPHGSVAALVEDCITCAVDALITEGGGPAWDEQGFSHLTGTVRARLNSMVLDVLDVVRKILTVARTVEQRAGDVARFAPEPSMADVRQQLGCLVYRGFITASGHSRLPDVLRYLRALEHRLEKLLDNPRRDAERTEAIGDIQRRYEDLRAAVPPGEGIDRVRWMIEELRVSYFAQSLGTAYPVSEKRIERAMAEV